MCVKACHADMSVWLSWADEILVGCDVGNLLAGLTMGLLLYLLLSTSRIDLYEPRREFLMHIMRRVSAQNQTQYIQCSSIM